MEKPGLPSRRDAMGWCAGIGASLVSSPLAWAQAPILARPIPQGQGETLPVVGTGTSIVFDVGASGQDRAAPTAVVHTLVAGGGSVIDTAPSYGAAEGVVGDILAATGLRPKIFIATKLEDYSRGGMAAEARQGLARLKTAKVDLLQLHNVNDPNQDMGELNGLKGQGLCRYTGITTTFKGSYGAAEAIVRRTRPDFLLIDYAIDNRSAEERVLPAARDAGTAVMTALPFGRGRLFRTSLGKPLPDFAKEFDCSSWAQFFLKFLLSHPAVTAVVPGTDKPEYMTDNLGAGRGKMPDAAMRARMVKYVEQMP